MYILTKWWTYNYACSITRLLQGQMQWYILNINCVVIYNWGKNTQITQALKHCQHATLYCIVPHASFDSTMQTGTHALLFLHTCKHEHVWWPLWIWKWQTNPLVSIFISALLYLILLHTKTTSHICLFKTTLIKNVKRKKCRPHIWRNLIKSQDYMSAFPKHVLLLISTNSLHNRTPLSSGNEWHQLITHWYKWLKILYGKTKQPNTVCLWKQ